MTSNHGEKFDPMVFGVIDPIIDAWMLLRR